MGKHRFAPKGQTVYHKTPIKMLLDQLIECVQNVRWIQVFTTVAPKPSENVIFFIEVIMFWSLLKLSLFENFT